MTLSLDMIRGLRAKPAKKIGLVLIFALVLIVVGCDVARAYGYVVDDYTSNLFWVEPAIAVIVCALPVYGHVLSRAGQFNAFRWWRQARVRRHGSQREDAGVIPHKKENTQIPRGSYPSPLAKLERSRALQVPFTGSIIQTQKDRARKSVFRYLIVLCSATNVTLWGSKNLERNSKRR